MPKDLYDIPYLEKLHTILWDLKVRSIELLSARHNDVIVDVGCGIGLDAINIARSGAKVYGIDHNPDMIAAALKQNVTGLDIKFICSEVYSIDLPDDSVDKVRFERVFQHLNDYDVALREVHRILKPGGQVQIIDPDYFCMTFFLEDVLLERKLVDNVCYKRIPNSYKIRQIPSFLKKNKFKLDLTEVHQCLIHDYSLATNIIRFEKVITEELEQGNINADELDNWNELKHLTKKNFNFSVNLMLFAATKI